MHPFVLASANDPETAIANHADDPELAFIAGGTDLIGLMKDRAALPRRLLDINKLPDMAGMEALPYRRAGPDERRRSASGRAPALSCHRGGAPVRRLWPAPQYGVDGRQHHAAHSLRLLPRRG